MPSARTRGNWIYFRASERLIYARTQLFFRHQRSHLFSQPRKILDCNLPHNIIRDSIIGMNDTISGRDYSTSIGNWNVRIP